MKPVDQIKITLNNPCHERRENMEATSCGMFCHVCSKEVRDFTKLSDVELMDVIRKYPTGCGSFRKEQLDMAYNLFEPVPAKKPLRIWAGILTVVSLLGTREADAQINNSAKVSISKVDFPGDSHKKDSVDSVGTIMQVLANPEVYSRRMGEYVAVRGSRSLDTPYIVDGNYGALPAPRKENIFKRTWRHVKRIF